MKNNLNDTSSGIPKFSLFHNNVRSLKRNFESLETHLLNELEYNFSVIGKTETKLAKIYRNIYRLYQVMNLNLFRRLFPLEVLVCVGM